MLRERLTSSETMLLLSFMIVLLAVAVDPAQGQAIKEIKADRVILDCEGPEDIEVTWNKDTTVITGQKKSIYEVEAEQGTVGGFYSCEYKTDPSEVIKHMFYLKVKVCQNCYELSGLMAWGVILGDLLFTGAIILGIYYCSTRNSDSTQKKASNTRSVNPPRPPNPDYEALDPKMRSSNATYAGLKK